jgi:hypothetical protein
MITERRRGIELSIDRVSADLRGATAPAVHEEER